MLEIKEQLKEAMRARDSLRVNTIKGLLAAFTNEVIAQKRKPDEAISDEDAISVIRRQVKQRKDSIEQFKKGGRKDLTEEEEKEMAILLKYLPQMMSREKISEIVKAKKAELKIEDKSKMGILMGAVIKETKGGADGALVKEVVEESLG